MELDSLQVADASPWPPIQADTPNVRAAEMMLSNVGACHSEMSALSLYFYNSTITRDRYPDVSECFHRISIVEMHHLDVFARLSLLLGADPRLWSGPPRRLSWWSPRCLSYPRERIPLLQNALHAERNAVAKYRQQASCVGDPGIAAVLERIILDEKRHIEIFEALLHEAQG